MNVALLTVISLSFSSNMYILCCFSFILINKMFFVLLDPDYLGLFYL